MTLTSFSEPIARLRARICSRSVPAPGSGHLFGDARHEREGGPLVLRRVEVGLALVEGEHAEELVAVDDRHAEPRADVGADVQAAAEGAVLLRVGDAGRRLARGPFAVWRVGV